MEFSRKELIQIVEQSSTFFERIEHGFIAEHKKTNDNQLDSLLEQWKQMVSQGNQEKFVQRLTWDNIDLASVNLALGSVQMSQEKQLPPWAITLNECINAATYSLETLDQCTSENNPFLYPHLLPFQEVLSPFVNVARKKLKLLTDSSYQTLSMSAHINIERSLLKTLVDLCAEPMELEFSIFRATRQSGLVRSLKKKRNENSTDQYLDFIRGLLGGKLLVFFLNYPVLARFVGIVINFWVDATKEFILRLESDWFDIQKTFQVDTDLGQVIQIESDLSDRHQNGRSVMGLTFGSGFKLIYKPKDLNLEKAYFNLLAWLNDQGIHLPFKLLKVIPRLNYGWVEYVEGVTCKDEDEVRRYYERAGMLLCLVYVFDAIDLHHENIIACGEQPIIIDLETLMHPWPREIDGAEIIENAQSIANQQLWHSVLRNGLLPQRIFDSEGQNYDVSGLGGISEQKTFLKVPKWRNINTNIMRLDYENAKTQNQPNLPSLNGVNLSLNHYSEELINGFRQMYDFLIKNREALLSSNSPLSEMAHQPIRFVFRATRAYSSILQNLSKPKWLRNGAERSIYVNSFLSNIIFSSDGLKPFWWPLLRVEQQSLEQLDIPIFFACSDSKDLTISSHQTLNEYFTEPSFNSVISRLENLNEQDLEKQIFFIEGSLYVHGTSEAHRTPSLEKSDPNFVNAITLTPEEILHQATTIAADLQKLAVSSTDGSAIWIAPQYIFDRQNFQFQPLGYGLYDGVCGVALFLAALEKVTGDSRYRSLTLAALQSLRQGLDITTLDKITDKTNIGNYAECGWIIYGLVRISQFLELPTLLNDAKKVALLITTELIAADQKFDVISGSAGIILGLLALYNLSADSEVLDRALLCGNHLLSCRVTSNLGYKVWENSHGELLTGFSHGAAGIAYALLRLYEVTGNIAFLEACLEANAYETSVFIPDVGNWPDLSSPQTAEGFTCLCSWCHGAPGIGLARLGGLDILDTDKIRQDIEVAINTTMRFNLRATDHLCCGNLGRIEFLFTAGQKLSRPQLLETALKQAAEVVSLAKHRGTFGYGPSYLTYSPGFFRGASGIGYELLRLAYPEQLPSVLLWE